MTGALTVTVQVAVLPPSVVVTVIVAVPAFFAVTTPSEDTVATVVLFDDQVTDLLEAFDGFTVAVSAWVSPSVKVSKVLSSITLVTRTIGAFTVPVQVAVLPPSVVVTVITAVPAFRAVTTPVEETDATFKLFEDQVRDGSVASDGLTVAVSVSVSPSVRVSEVLSSVTPVTDMNDGFTVTVHVADLLPSVVVTVIVAVPAFFAYTLPLDDTVATSGLSDDQRTFLNVASDGLTVAVRVSVSPSVKLS